MAARSEPATLAAEAPAPVPERLRATLAYAGERAIRIELVDVVADVLADDLAWDPADAEIRALAERIMAAIAVAAPRSERLGRTHRVRRPGRRADGRTVSGPTPPAMADKRSYVTTGEPRDDAADVDDVALLHRLDVLIDAADRLRARQLGAWPIHEERTPAQLEAMRRANRWRLALMAAAIIVRERTSTT
jgi:hypothetical protein